MSLIKWAQGVTIGDDSSGPYFKVGWKRKRRFLLDWRWLRFGGTLVACCPLCGSLVGDDKARYAHEDDHGIEDDTDQGETDGTIPPTSADYFTGDVDSSGPDNRPDHGTEQDS